MYTCNQLPLAWIVQHNGAYWIVPAMHNGWTKRRQYRGYVSALQKCTEYNSIGLGIPA